jgi:hypothetical protein
MHLCWPSMAVSLAVDVRASFTAARSGTVVVRALATMDADWSFGEPEHKVLCSLRVWCRDLDWRPSFEVQRDCAPVEAFPNCFLGVLLPEATYERCDRRNNERKSDWMHRKAAEQGTFAGLLAELGWVDARTEKQFRVQASPDGSSRPHQS